ncbi:MAG: U32 family peptidase [Eubacteriales bacterium]|nr:U32 family peptidase [Eubacteriales bacterium]
MNIELLAPAGSYEGLIQNLDCGADAVYVGGRAFGARAYAQNLSEEQLLQAIDEAHIRSRKVYLTVNTLLKNQELYQELYDYLLPFYEQGLDAVIVQDLGVLSFVRREFPGMHIHASTQMAVTGPEAAALLEKNGVNRVVTARELSLEEISSIRRTTNMEIESFVHGALCYSYSGQCLFSSILGGRSGNRGRCAQPCRLPYQVYGTEGRLTKGKEMCPLSPKDMNTIDILPKIIEAGVTSLKIEGRMKQSSYAAGVVSIYRKYLDLYLENPKNYRVEEQDKKDLVALFSRGGSCKGYYEMRNGRQMMAFSNEKKTGEVTGQIRKMKEKVKGNFMLSVGKRAKLRLEYNKAVIEAEADVVQEAKKQPLDEARIRAQMEKTGNTPYEFEKLDIQLEGNVFLPMSSVNQIRREAFCQLQNKIAESFRREIPKRTEETEFSGNRPQEQPVFTAACETMEQAEALRSIPGISGIYCNWDFVLQFLKESCDKEIYMMLPHVIRTGDMQRLSDRIRQAIALGCRRVLVRSLESAAWMVQQGYGAYCVLDSGMYTFNNESMEFWRQQGIDRFTAPLELNGRELRGRCNKDSEMMVYGYIPMMISAQCVQKNLDTCRKNYATLTLKDRYDKQFRVKCYCGFCYNIIYNSLPYGLLKERQDVKKLGFDSLRLNFTLESFEETRKIAKDFIQCYQKDVDSCVYTLTKGHFKRGVE